MDIKYQIFSIFKIVGKIKYMYYNNALDEMLEIEDEKHNIILSDRTARIVDKKTHTSIICVLNKLPSILEALYKEPEPTLFD